MLNNRTNRKRTLRKHSSSFPILLKKTAYLKMFKCQSHEAAEFFQGLYSQPSIFFIYKGIERRKASPRIVKVETYLMVKIDFEFLEKLS